MDITDTLLERPFGFRVGKKHFFIYPNTIGKMMLINRLLSQLEINNNLMAINPAMETLRVASVKKKECCLIAAYATYNKKEDLLDYPKVEKRMKFFEKEIEIEDLATLLMVILTTDKTEEILRKSGIQDELERMKRVMKVKESKNSVSFGGQTIYGTQIDAACERYGWTYDYVVWGISYANLRLLLADKINTMYLTDEELKKTPKNALKRGDEVIRADDPKNREKILAMDWK